MILVVSERERAKANKRGFILRALTSPNDKRLVAQLPIVAQGRQAIYDFVQDNNLTWVPDTILFGGHYADYTNGNAYLPDVLS